MEKFSAFIAQHLGLFYLLSTTLVALMVVEFIRSRRTQHVVGTKDAILLINRKNAVVIDIRANENYKSGHIVDAISAPLPEWNEKTKKLDKYKNKPLIVVCNTGVDSQKTAASLSKQGYTVYALAGGMRAWTSAELPLVKE